MLGGCRANNATGVIRRTSLNRANHKSALSKPYVLFLQKSIKCSIMGTSSHCAHGPHFLVLVSNAREKPSPVTGHPVPVPQRCHRGIRLPAAQGRAAAATGAGVGQRAGYRPEHRQGALLAQPRPGGADRLDHQADDRHGRARLETAAGRGTADRHQRDQRNARGVFPGAGRSQISRRDMLLLA